MKRLLLIVTILFVRASYAATGTSTLKGPCEYDLQTYCADVHPGEGRVGACLKKYKDNLTDECTEFLKKSGKLLDVLEGACSEDVNQYCRDIRTSYRRILACLEEHLNDVSTKCRNIIKPASTPVPIPFPSNFE